jgi:hypothetical protein
VYAVVAFDTYYDQNDTIYAGLAHAFDQGGIYLWVIGAEPEQWQKLAAEPHDYTGIVLDRASPSNPYTSAATGGVLYASFFDWDESNNCDSCGCDDGDGYYCWHSGVARCLTPITELCCGVGEAEWDYLTWGLEGDESFFLAPHVLKICGCLTADSNSNLFAVDGYEYDMIDGEEGTVWTFEDCYAKKAVELTSPVDGFVVPADPCGCCNAPFAIKWDRPCDACCYEVQFALDEDFTDLVMTEEYLWGCYCPLSPMDPSAWVGCYFTPEFTYYWRVRTSQGETCQEIHSWWSEAQSFMVAPTAAAAEIELISPVPGATGVGIENVGFSWHLLASADDFDWVLDDNADLSSPIESKTGLTGTAYQCTETLDYGTTYFWEVIAYKGGSAIAMSAIGVFTTASSNNPSSGGGGCFIATAAYGTPMAEDVKVLRDFRDEYLLTNQLGQAFVDFYYTISPSIAEFIADHPSLKPIVRAGLVPAVVMSTIAVSTTAAEKAVIIGLVALVSVGVAVWVTRRRGRGPEYL